MGVNMDQVQKYVFQSRSDTFVQIYKYKGYDRRTEDTFSISQVDVST